MTITPLRDLLASSVGIVLLFVAPCVAPRDISAKIDAYIKAEMRRQQIPGVSLAVVRNGKIALVKSYGFSRRGRVVIDVHGPDPALTIT